MRFSSEASNVDLFYVAFAQKLKRILLFREKKIRT